MIMGLRLHLMIMRYFHRSCLYEKSEPKIANCQNCTLNKTKEEFQACMDETRDQMFRDIELVFVSCINEHLEKVKSTSAADCGGIE